jgi:acylpyruvate hydrolase
LISAGAEGISKVTASLPSSGELALDSLKMAPAIHNPEKIICIGLNYSDHCTEQNLTPPKEPVVFNKFPSTLVGHGDAIQLPKIGCNTGKSQPLLILKETFLPKIWKPS